MKKTCFILSAWVLFSLTGCGEDSENDVALYVNPDAPVVVPQTGVAEQFVVGISGAWEGTARVTVKSADENRVRLTFLDGSSSTVLDSKVSSALVSATCLDNGSYSTDAVNLQFIVDQMGVPLKNNPQIRQIFCPASQHPGVGVLVSPTTGLFTSEDGQVASFTVKLASQPGAAVKIAATSSDPTEGSVAPSVVTFTPDNWNVAQTLTVTGVDDDEVDGDVSYSVNLSTDQSDDATYRGISVPPVTLVNLDNDGGSSSQSGIIVSPTTGLRTGEDGTTASFTVVLKSQPSADVIITAKSFDETEGVVSPAQHTFTTQDWNQPKTFTITGQDDAEIDGDITYSVLVGPAQSADLSYHGMTVPSLSVVNVDDDRYTETANMTVSASALTIYEGGNATFTVRPTVEPSAPVTVTLTSTDTSEATLDPASLTFSASNWTSPQTVTVTAPRDGEEDGEQTYQIKFVLTSMDPRFNAMSLAPIDATTVDTEGGSGETVTLRAMAANISTGNKQSYDPGHGIRIFQAVKPDIVMIQEFRYGNNDDASIRKMVNTAFGAEYVYHRGRYLGNEWIPNGIISNRPIIDSGYWKSNKISNRDWDWALIDLPGTKELLVVSIHLSASDNAAEVPSLTSSIQKKISSDKAAGLEYHVMVGGDFNSASTSNGKNELKNVVYTSVELPVDQNNDDSTNETRSKTLDMLFVDRDLHVQEIPAAIGRYSYEHGHVFDSRVYYKRGELGDVPPVQKDDSEGGNGIMNQHMAVIRDFEFTAK